MKKRLALLFVTAAFLTVIFAYEINLWHRREEGKILITLTRTECFGGCPVYDLKINEDGRVVFTGKRFVKIKGKRVAHISPARVRALVSRLKADGYFNMKNNYEKFEATDMPYAVTGVEAGGRKKRIKHYYGDFTTPAKLTDMESRIDRAANSERWIK